MSSQVPLPLRLVQAIVARAIFVVLASEAQRHSDPTAEARESLQFFYARPPGRLEEDLTDILAQLEEWIRGVKDTAQRDWLSRRPASEGIVLTAHSTSTHETSGYSVGTALLSSASLGFEQREASSPFWF